MDNNLDLTLPASAPAEYTTWLMERTGLDPPVAVYTLVEFSDDELQELVHDCETDCFTEEEDAAGLPPNHRFIGRPLRDVYEAHLQHGRQETFDPGYFIVAFHRDWNKMGVLLVTVRTDEEPPTIDKFFMHAKDSAVMVQNLNIYNTDWEEAKANCEIVPGEDSDDDDENHDSDGEDELPTDKNEDQSDDEGPEFPSKKPKMDYIIPIYFLHSLDPDGILQSLTKDIHHMSNSKDFLIRNQGILRPSIQPEVETSTLHKPDPAITEDLIAQASAVHPVRCRANKWLNKTYFLLVDSTNFSGEGIIMVKLTWDGVAKGRSKNELREVGSKATRQSKRMEGNYVDTIQYGYCMIEEGIAIWQSKRPKFAVFQANIDLPHHGVKVVDSQYWDRASGDGFFTVGWKDSSSLGDGETEMPWTLDEAVNRFPWFCSENPLKYEPLFNYKYFVWIDHDKVEDEGVVLVRYDWDGDINRSKEELRDLKQLDKVHITHVAPGEALSALLNEASGDFGSLAWEPYNRGA
jgi:hypothetical protein